MSLGWQRKLGLVCLTAGGAFLGVFAFAYLYFLAAPHPAHVSQAALLAQSASAAVRYGMLLTPIMSALVIYRIEARRQART